MKLGNVASDFGKGNFAGVAGTAAMTLSSTIEMKVRGRPASATPAQAAAKVLGVKPVDEEATARFSTLVHWGTGPCGAGLGGFSQQRGSPDQRLLRHISERSGAASR